MAHDRHACLGAYPVWPDTFPHTLALHGEEVLLRPLRMDFASYGTARMMMKQSAAPRKIVAAIEANQKGPKCQIPIEELPAPLKSELARHGLRFAPEEAIGGLEIVELLSKCIGPHLNRAPHLQASVRFLVRALHILEAESDEHDVSYSAPEIPFSIFVSVPRSNGASAALRVLESIIHETMHLQLSLLEQNVPLITAGADFHMYSPWRKSQRKAHGILHALYVFRVIEQFWGGVLTRDGGSEAIGFAKARCAEIRDEIRQVSEFIKCPFLTESGRALVERLVAQGPPSGEVGRDVG